MAHIPYGYIIENGRACIDEKLANQVKELFQAYVSGFSLVNAARQAGIDRCPKSIANMLTCRRYLGDGFYPPIIDENTFRRAEDERMKRAQKIRRKRNRVEKKISAIKHFKAPNPEKLYDDPYAQAEYAYSLIEIQVISNG
jgi:hypothetical protein